MAKKKPLSHFSPVFSNKYWANENAYLSYFYCQYEKEVKSTPQGKKQWGRKRGLYTWDVERALDRDLETKVAPIYEKLLIPEELIPSERIVWSQFLMSQLVRTPTFIRYETAGIRYETAGKEKWGIDNEPLHDRVGCTECGDLYYIANRDWYLLIAYEDDYFVRSDNPVLLSGFVEESKTCLYYPLTPKVCFVACSMPNDWPVFTYKPKNTYGHRMDKGAAHILNFHLARAASESLIISPGCKGEIADRMFGDILGKYPQPPFTLHSPSNDDVEQAYISINEIMNYTDGLEYPSWKPFEAEPFYSSGV
ncbi:MAG: DUF4238 domain-containing protein [Gammaproteobacteria bacterium]|nr:DUF4238 domain-containing protein [Gammaproteobacteria bacterium]